MPDRIHEKLIQRQLGHGSRLRSALRVAPEPGAPRPLPVITLSRQAGCGCREVADALGARLGLEVFGREIVEQISRDRDLSREVVAALDERVRSGVEQWVRGMLDSRFFLQDDFHLALVRAVRGLAARGGVILVGRGANFVLADTVDLRVRLVAPEDWRVRHLAMRRQVPEDEARLVVRELEAMRAAFVRRLFRAEVAEAGHYDLVLDIARFGRDDAVAVIEAALARRIGRATQGGDLSATDAAGPP